MQRKIDFTDCKKIIGRAYNGANGKKIAVEYNGEDYIEKKICIVYHDEGVASAAPFFN